MFHVLPNSIPTARPLSPLSLLLFAGPILWWLDKAHSEPFSFALLTIAILLTIERPWWALLAAGVATTQNLPIGVVIPLIVVANAIWNRPVAVATVMDGEPKIVTFDGTDFKHQTLSTLPVGNGDKGGAGHNEN